MPSATGHQVLRPTDTSHNESMTLCSVTCASLSARRKVWYAGTTLGIACSVVLCIRFAWSLRRPGHRPDRPRPPTETEEEDQARCRSFTFCVGLTNFPFPHRSKHELWLPLCAWVQPAGRTCARPRASPARCRPRPPERGRRGAAARAVSCRRSVRLK